MASNAKTEKGYEPQIVIGIDFGTTGSGYAFQTRADYKSDRLRIYENLDWGTERSQYKTPTCLLVNPERNECWFGDEAEREYSRLTPKDNPNLWFFFRNFKMQIYNKEITQDMVLTSENGNELSAVFVFSESIKWMKTHALNYLERTNCRYLEMTTKWVLTVPAIWSETAKQLMRTAAKKAGINGENLCIALEPEVAAIYCATAEANPPDIVNRDLDKTMYTGPGKTNMVVDMGGGTVDITTIEVEEDGTMKQTHVAEGGPLGGQKVDEKFFRFMSNVFGESIWEKFMQTYPSYVYDFRMSFEREKRNLSAKLRHDKARDELHFHFPDDIIRDFERKNEADIATSLKHNELMSDNVTFEFGKLVVKGKVLREMMNISLDEILEYVTKYANDVRTSGRRIDAVLLVGGFASSKFMTDNMRKRIQDNLRLETRRPAHCEMAVLRGAVLYGHNENILTARVARMTYGIGVTMPYGPKYSDFGDRKFTLDGNAYITGVFATHVLRGQEVKIDHWISANEYYPLETSQRNATVYLFASEQKDVKLVDEKGCECIGKFEISFGDGGQISTDASEISLNFGRTELIFRARDKKTGREVFESLCLE